MIVTLIPYCPHTEGKNLGLAYNELMARLRDDDWPCFLDHDACFTTPDWYAQLEEITAGLTEPCVLTALTNRVGSPWQLAPGVERDNHAVDYHRRVGKAIQTASRGVLRDRETRTGLCRDRLPPGLRAEGCGPARGGGRGLGASLTPGARASSRSRRTRRSRSRGPRR